MIQWEGATGLGEETNYGQGVSPTRYIAVLRGNANPTRVGADDDRATGQRWRFRHPLLGFDYAFDWEQWVEPRNIGEVLKWALGKVESIPHPDEGSGEFRHTFSHIASIPSFSLSIDRNVGSNPTIRYVGSRMNALTLENGARDVLRGTVEGASQKEEEVAALSPDTVEFEYDPYMFHQLSVYIGLNGASPAYDPKIERVQVAINNDLITDKVTANSSLYIAELPIGRFIVTGEFDREFESKAEYNAFIANQQLDIRCKWLGISMGVAPYKIEYDIPDAVILSLELPEVAGATERGIYTVAFEAEYYDTDSKMISVELDNDISTY